MFLKLDGTFWFQLINFGIFFTILNVVFLRPVGEAIKQRRVHIDGVHRDYETYARELAGLREEAAARRLAGRRDADHLIASSRQGAEHEAQSLLEGSGSQAQAIVDQARATVALEANAARGRSAELSQALAQTLLDRALQGRTS